tara:strand:- start:347 stop:1183 length:837 start_codon:yes stop_codon:yes gene_type:complete
VKKLKKTYRVTSKLFLFSLSNLLSKILRVIGLDITPALHKLSPFNYDYSNSTRRLVYKPNNKSFNKIIIDTSLYNSFLCQLGKKYSTNKSPFNLNGHRIGYTGIYNFLFHQLRNKKINFAEIGIEKNGSIRMWRSYFKKAKIYGLEFDINKIRNAKKYKLKNTHYHKINVNKDESLKKTFKKIKKRFDIVVDDSTHNFEDQIKIIKNCYRYLNNNGLLIIEDIYKYQSKHTEKRYYENLKGLKKYFSDIVFLETNNVNNFTASWKCEKILLLIRNNKN